MDKQTLKKLRLLLQSITYRIKEEPEYFIGLEGEFKSGAKIYPLVLKHENNKLIIHFAGRSDTIDIDGFSDLLSGYASQYDSVKIIYKARGETLVIEANDKNVTMKTRQMEDKNKEMLSSTVHGMVSAREYLIKPGKADSLLKAIGIMTVGGKIKNDMIRKYNQIDHFVELVEPMLRELYKGRNELKIVDCACGKSYLSFVLNYYLKDVMKINCRFTGIDISDKVINASRQIAEGLGYRNMKFIKGDIRTLLYEEQGSKIQPDLVISLHACDAATDYALAYGIRNRARGIIAVPCCHSELLNQYSYEPFRDIIKHGIFKARLADVLTDGLRCMILEAFGYSISAVEYVSPLDTPKNLLIRATLTDEFSHKKYDACKALAKTLNADPTLLKETAE
jgi:SAM-dependent methyltransferase